MRAAGDDTSTLPEDAGALRMLLLEALARCDTLSAELGTWSCPHQTGQAAWVADCAAMNSRGESMRKPL